MQKNLVIVESPAKAKTIEKFLGKEYKVLSSHGHICDLADKTFTSIASSEAFEPTYEVADDKQKIVAELRANVKKAEMVWLASDEDREGESIAWHLQRELNLPEETKNRIVFHEITKQAIVNAISSPRTIDKNIVDAQQARRVMDKIVGFEISPILWHKVRGARSAGRVQSVALRLIVEREREIENTVASASFRVQATFKTLDGELFTANLNRSFSSEAEARAFLESCRKAEYCIVDVTKHPAKRNPSPPFTTSTLQQEAARKFSFPVSLTMRVAQSLYENGKITYMRTDSVNLSSLAVATAGKEIKSLYGNEYHFARSFTTKTKGAQEAHEAIRPTYIENQTITGTEQEKKLYSLIWKRTIASQMAAAQIERTTAKIAILGRDDYYFTAEGEVTLFDGFMRAYTESRDDESERQSVLPSLSVERGALTFVQMQALERFAPKPARYTEASLVRKLEELGIGRPSTYAPIISTLMERNYVDKRVINIDEREYRQLTLTDRLTATTKKEKATTEKNKLSPTDIGIILTDYLMERFGAIMDYQFTANIETRFDTIASGENEWHATVKEFYDDFHPLIAAAQNNDDSRIGARELGIDPATGLTVSVKIGRFGKPIVQLGNPDELAKDEKPKFAPLPENMHLLTITLEQAIKVLSEKNKVLGLFNDTPITIGAGRFGPYICYGAKNDKKYVSIPKTIDPETIDHEKAVELIEAKILADKNKIICSFDDEGIQVINGRFGPYVAYNNENYKIPKGVDPANFTIDDCKRIIADPACQPKRKAAPKTTQKKSTSTTKKRK